MMRVENCHHAPGHRPVDRLLHQVHEGRVDGVWRTLLRVHVPAHWYAHVGEVLPRVGFKVLLEDGSRRLLVQINAIAKVDPQPHHLLHLSWADDTACSIYRRAAKSQHADDDMNSLPHVVDTIEW